MIMRKIYIAGFTVLSVLSVSAQEDTTRAKELTEVVITGQYKPQSVKNSVYQVKVISKERIEKQAASKLQDLLTNELNIRFSQDMATGGSNITMMGLGGQNVKILLDGLPLAGRQGFNNEININQIDINSVERIEIIEGPMSVIYGADALAGVINIITKKASASRFSITARVQEETVGKEYGIQEGVHNQYIGLTWRNKKWDASGSFGYNYFGGWKGNSAGRELNWHWKDQLIANGSVGYTSSRFNIRYRIDGLDEIITNPGNYTSFVPEAGDSVAHDQEYLSRRVMHQLQAGYFVNSNLSFQGQAAYTAYQRQVYSTVLSKNTGKFSMDAPEEQSLDKISSMTFRGTALYKISSLVSLQPGVDINIESGEGQRLKTGTNRIEDYAFFVTSEITPFAGISVRPGLRFIKNSVYDAPPVIPSINAKFSLGKNIDIRAAYANGFRSPSLRELYFNFRDANHTIIGNPDLKAEISNSFTLSLNVRKVTPRQLVYTTVLSGFYNDIRNKIDYAFADANTAVVSNVSNSKTGGVNFSTIVKYRNWSLSVGAAYTGFYNIYTESDESLPQLQWSPEGNVSAGYTFSKIGLDANVFYKFTGKQPSYVQSGQDILLSKLDAYHTADITFNKRFHKTFFRYFLINAGVRNLFDVTRVSNTVVNTGGVHVDGGTGRNLAYGRSYFAGIVFNWDKK